MLVHGQGKEGRDIGQNEGGDVSVNVLANQHIQTKQKKFAKDESGDQMADDPTPPIANEDETTDMQTQPTHTFSTISNATLVVVAVVIGTSLFVAVVMLMVVARVYWRRVCLPSRRDHSTTDTESFLIRQQRHNHSAQSQDQDATCP